jgi:hypothetical protein
LGRWFAPPPLIADTALNVPDPVLLGLVTAKYVKGLVVGIERDEFKYVAPPNVRTLRPFKALLVSVGFPVAAVALYPFPDLSFQVVTDVPDRTKLEVSAASNHNDKPGILCGENGHVFIFETTEFIDIVSLK